MQTSVVSGKRQAPPGRPVVAGKAGTPLLSLLACAALLALFSVVDETFVSVAPFAFFFAVAVVATRRRLAPLALSPAFYVAVILAAIGLLGFFFSNALDGSGYDAGVRVILSDEVRVATANAMLGFAILVLLAASVVRGRSSPGAATDRLDLGDLSPHAGWFVLFAAVALATIVYYTGFDNLVSRDVRLIERESGIQNIVMMVGLGAVVVASVALFSRVRFYARVAFLEIVAFVVVYFSMSSRRLALIPVLIFLGYLIARRGQVSKVGLALTGAASFILLALPLSLRFEVRHGAVPYLQALPNVVFDRELLAGMLNNSIAGYKITALTAYSAPSIPLENLWISLNPGLGDDVGWADIEQSMRISYYVPYSAVGELFNYGVAVAVAIAIVLGLLLGLLQRLGDRSGSSVFARLAALTSLGLAAMGAISATQYTLRSVARYFLLALAIQAAVYLFGVVRGMGAPNRAGRSRPGIPGRRQRPGLAATLQGVNASRLEGYGGANGSRWDD